MRARSKEKTMTLIKTEALILKNIAFKESSSILQLFTKDYGRVSVIAKGAKRFKSQFRGYLEPLNHLSVIYVHKPTRDIQILTNVEIIHTFIPNINNIEASTYATAILELITKIIHTNEEQESLFQLTLDSLNFIDNNLKNCQTGFIYFLLQAINLLGFKLNLTLCPICSNLIKDGYYSSFHYELICDQCMQSGDIQINKNQIDFLKKLESDFNHEISYIDTPKNGNNIIDFLLNYTGHHFEIYPKLKSLDLLKYL